MNIRSIHLAGPDDPSIHMPRIFIHVARAIDELGSRLIEIEVKVLPDTERNWAGHQRCHPWERVRYVPDSKDGIGTLGKYLQRKLDGHRGTKSEVEEYARMLQHLMGKSSKSRTRVARKANEGG